TKSLNTEQHQKNVKTQNLFYVLADMSYSMDEYIPTFQVTRKGFTDAVVLALLERVNDNKTKLYYRGFQGDVGSLHKALEHKDIKPLRDYILNTGPGGGTNTANALRVAIDDIAKARAGLNPDLPNMEKAELLVISDAEDTID
ncbi:unnamed protein product, partial [marine sediment metagenome]